jgi:hypothetical protein
MPTQLEVLKSIRRPMAPASRVERPNKGGGYRRLQGNFSKWLND